MVQVVISMKVFSKGQEPKEFDRETMLVFFSMAQAACSTYKKGFDKKHFVTFAKEIWDTMIMNGPEEFSNTTRDAMILDLVKHGMEMTKE